MIDLKKLIPDREFNRHLLLFLYCFILLTSGLLYKAGSFEEYCVGASDKKFSRFSHGYSVDCRARQMQISFLSTLAVTTHIISSPVPGLMIDLIGPKICYVIGQVFQIVAWIMFAFFPRNIYVLRASFFIMGFFAEAQVIPLIPVCKLYPDNQYFIISLIGTLRSLSFGVPSVLYLIFSVKHFRPSDIYKIGYIYIFASVVPSLAIGIFTVPWNIETKMVEDDDEEKRKKVNDDEVPKLTLKDRCRKLLDTIRRMFAHPSFFECFLTCICIFTQMARVDILNKAQRQLFKVSNSDSACTAVGYAIILAFIPCPMFGFISDKYGPPTAFIIIQIFSCISIVFLIFDNIVSKYISVIGYLFSASFFISSVYSFVNWRIDKKYFGRVTGAMFVFIGTFLTTNILLMKAAVNDIFGLGSKSYDAIPYLCMIHCVVGMVSAGVLYYVTRPPREKGEIEP